MKTSQIPAAIAAMLSYADAQGVTNIVRDTLIALRTFTTDPRRGCQVGSGVELARTVERKTGRPWRSLSMAERELFEVHHAVTIATVTESYDDEGNLEGFELAAQAEFVRSLAVAA